MQDIIDGEGGGGGEARGFLKINFNYLINIHMALIV